MSVPEGLKESGDSMAQHEARPQRKVSITEHVIASIAGMAASSVDGVSGLHGNVADSLKAFLGDERNRQGVIARVRDDDVSVTLYVSVEYGYPIQDVARTLQSQVKREIEELTGLRAQGIHVYVSDLTLPEGAWPTEADATTVAPHDSDDDRAPETHDDGNDSNNGNDGNTGSHSASAQELRERS